MLILPALLERSPCDWPLIEVSLLALAEPHKVLSRCAGDWEMTGLLCTLTPGDTARRLIEASSKSSSRRRLLDFFNASAAVGGCIGPGVDARDAPLCSAPVVGLVGESMLMSSLIADDSPRWNDGGGGVCAARWFQKPLLTELRPVFRLPSAPKSPLVVEPSRLILLSLPSSGTPSSGPSSPGTVGSRLGDDCAVTDVRSVSTSLSRTWRIISASRRNSLSTGAASSNSSALMRPNCLDFG